MNLRIILFTSIGVILVGVSSAQIRSRMDVLEDYHENFVGTHLYNSQIDWTGNTTGCVPGTVQPEVFENTLKRINFYRRLVNIEDDITWNNTKNSKCQDMALMIKINGLSHAPPPTWTCYTTAGAQAAAASNLARHNAVISIERYIQDSGTPGVGHRRWLLYPFATEMGMGSTNNSSAIWVVGDFDPPAVIPDFVAYPSPGYFPEELEYPFWSFSVTNADFTNTSITLTNENNETIPTTIYPLQSGSGDNTIVFSPTIAITTDYINGHDSYFTVTITDVLLNQESKDYFYEVLIIPDTFQQAQFFITNENCGLRDGKCRIAFPHGYKNIAWSSGETDTSNVSGLVAGEYQVSVTDKLGTELVYYFEIGMENPVEQASITPLGSTTFCSGDSLTLVASTASEYSWSTGATEKEIVVYNMDTISLVVMDSAGCSDTAFIIIDEAPVPVPIRIDGNTQPLLNSVEDYHVIGQYESSQFNWSVDNGQILNGNGTDFVQVQWPGNFQSGNICVQEVDTSGCRSSYLCLAIEYISATNENNKQDFISIFPNPAQGQLFVDAPITPAEINLYNIDGQPVLSIIDNQWIDITHLLPGVYFVNIKSNGIEVQLKRIVVY